MYILEVNNIVLQKQRNMYFSLLPPEESLSLWTSLSQVRYLSFFSLKLSVVYGGVYMQLGQCTVIRAHIKFAPFEPRVYLSEKRL